jgi:hypothetical protein
MQREKKEKDGGGNGGGESMGGESLGVLYSFCQWASSSFFVGSGNDVVIAGVD